MSGPTVMKMSITPGRERNCLARRVCWIALTGLLVSCQAGNFELPGSRKIYRNRRFGYEFPYPSHWILDESPGNRDGQVLVHPENPAIKIQGWAGNSISTLAVTPIRSSQAASSALNQNFETEQGLFGNLQIEIGETMSSMTLTLVQENVSYSLRSQSPNEEFADYYSLFYTTARQYRLQRQIE